MSTDSTLGEYFPYNRRASDKLCRRAHKWLNDLPLEIRPFKLIELRPQIANEISLLWDDENSCRKCLCELIHKHTDPKYLKNFVPVPFLQEIINLYDFRSKKMIEQFDQTHSKQLI